MDIIQRNPVLSRADRRRGSIGWTIAIVAVSLLFLLPLVAMLGGSFRGPGLPPPRGLEIVPRSAGLEGYREAFRLVPLARSLLNSTVVALVAVPIAVVTASWAGYAMARMSRRWRRRLVAFLLVMLMVPLGAVWFGRFTMFNAANLTDTYVPLIATAFIGGSPLFVLLYLLAFRRIPPELIDAARLEGVGEWQIWRRIAMPLVRGTTIAVALLVFAITWGNFLDPLIYLTTESRYTAPLVLRSLEQLGPTNWPVILAGSVAVTAPVIVAFAFALRRIVPRKGFGWFVA